MTDITELAQSLKAAATNVKETAHIARYLKATIARQTFKELMTPDNILALVEALEKAQQRITQLESRAVTVKLPNSNDERFWGYGSEFEVELYDSYVFCALTAAGIKVEAE
ncbi:TPA: hypothetical protein ACGEDP_003954 [Klebsiella pneumoniae]